ncbi:MAG: hypothetical protein P4M14_09670 [Gammaproteobacteria bacterium]|nr:hypothetical protein [Gammaproteobacteria bacterium]
MMPRTNTDAPSDDLNAANDPAALEPVIEQISAVAAAVEAKQQREQALAAAAEAKQQADDEAKQKAINAEYKLLLLPLSHKIMVDRVRAPDNTIILKKDQKKGIVKAYLVQNGQVSQPITGLNLSAAEIEVLAFPADDQEPAVLITRQQFPELIDKVSLRCGLTTNKFGSYSAIVFAFGCGITTVAALALLMTGPLFFVAAAILGTSTTVANWRMSRYDLPEIFNGGVKYLFHNKVKVNVNGVDQFVAEPISLGRKIALGFGITCSIAFGAAIAILTYSATMALPASFPILAAASAFLPPVGIALAAVTLISLSVIMIKSMSDLAKSKSLVQSLKNAFNNIFHIDPVKDKGFVGHAKRIATWALLGVLSAGALTLTFLGAVFTLKSCMAGLNSALRISSAALNVVSTVVVRGLALVAQIPFTLITTLNPILQLFYRWPEKQVAVANNGNAELEQAPLVVAIDEVDPDEPVIVKSSAFTTFLGAMASIINAVGNGLIALNGQKFDITTAVGVGTTGAIANSFASTFGNTISTDIPAPVGAAAPVAAAAPQQAAEEKAEQKSQPQSPRASSTASLLGRDGFQSVPNGNAAAEQKQPASPVSPIYPSLVLSAHTPIPPANDGVNSARDAESTLPKRHARSHSG